MMIFKRLTCFFIVFLLVCSCLCATAHAVDYTVYNSSISETYQEYFKRILIKKPFNVEYVVFRASNNEYYCFYSTELELHNGTEFICNTTIDGIKIDTVSVSGTSYNTYQSVSHFQIDSLNIEVDDKIVYSSLGDYPILYESGEIYEQMQTTIILICCIFTLLWFIFRKCTRF